MYDVILLPLAILFAIKLIAPAIPGRAPQRGGARRGTTHQCRCRRRHRPHLDRRGRALSWRPMRPSPPPGGPGATAPAPHARWPQARRRRPCALRRRKPSRRRPAPRAVARSRPPNSPCPGRKGARGVVRPRAGPRLGRARRPLGSASPIAARPVLTAGRSFGPTARSGTSPSTAIRRNISRRSEALHRTSSGTRRPTALPASCCDGKTG